MNSNQQFQGYLFENIGYKSQEDVTKFVETLDSKQSLYSITQALEMANSKGLFSIQECEILSKSLRIIENKLIDEQKQKTLSD